MSKLTIRYLVLAALPLFVFGCGHDSPSTGGGTGGTDPVGSGGSSGGGGSTEGSGGTSGGSGGASAGSGGATGSGGAVVVGSGGSDGGTSGDGGIATCVAVTATSPLISDFATGTAPASNQATGGTDVWTVSPQGKGTATVVTGEMHAQTTGGDWGSTGTVLGNAKCVDVTRYTGIKFKIRSATNTALLFVVSTPETTGDSSNFRMQIAVTPTSTVVTVPFASLVKAPFGTGMALSNDYKPAAHLYGIGFGVGVMTELLDIFLDDVTFY